MAKKTKLDLMLELEEARQRVYSFKFRFVMVVVVLLISFMAVSFAAIYGYNNLFNENQRLKQDMQYSNWTLKFYCEENVPLDSNPEIVLDLKQDGEIKFENYSFYREFEKNFQKKLPNSCEIIR